VEMPPAAAKIKYGDPLVAGGMKVVCSSGKYSRYGDAGGAVGYVSVWSALTEIDAICRRVVWARMEGG
jgi:hypothetical protein